MFCLVSRLSSSFGRLNDFSTTCLRLFGYGTQVSLDIVEPTKFLDLVHGCRWVKNNYVRYITPYIGSTIVFASSNNSIVNCRVYWSWQQQWRLTRCCQIQQDMMWADMVATVETSYIALLWLTHECYWCLKRFMCRFFYSTKDSNIWFSVAHTVHHRPTLIALQSLVATSATWQVRTIAPINMAHQF